MNALNSEQREIMARLQSGRLMICEGQGDPNSDGCGGQGYTGAAGQEPCGHCFGAGVMTRELLAALTSRPGTPDALAKLAEIPPAGSEERDFWLEAASQHGFMEPDTDDAGDTDSWLASEAAILTLMSEARKQGQRDVLGAEARAVPEDREALRKTLTEITDAADKLILTLPGHWHDDATIELTDAASDARTILAAAAQNDLYEVVPALASQAATDVLAERRRQVEAEGWTAAHDDGHAGGDLAAAAACYAWSGGRDDVIERTRIRDALNDRFGSDIGLPIKRMWPWDSIWWKPKADPRADLVKAGALILAEIERRDRAALATGGAHG